MEEYIIYLRDQRDILLLGFADVLACHKQNDITDEEKVKLMFDAVETALNKYDEIRFTPTP